MYYVWNDFGMLMDVIKQSGYVIICNEQGETRKMSITKYKDKAERVYEDALELIGERVDVKTSQWTNDWSEYEWFSDIDVYTENK